MKKLLLALFGVASLAAGANAQSLSYNSGQNIAPSYEGWEEDADGTKYFVFGYMNRNWEEEVVVPVGPANGFGPGNADLGQPTRFLPRRNRFIFRTRVPATFTDKDELVWTVTANGKTEKAWASLRVDYKLDDVVKASETGALGAGTSNPEIRANKPPVVQVLGEKTLRARVGEPVTLASVVTDDGIPKVRRGGQAPSAAARAAAAAERSAGEGAEPAAPRRNPMMQPPIRITAGKNVGLHHSYYVFRGAGEVIFAPAQIKVWEDTRAGADSPWAPIWVAPPMPADGKVTAQVTFAEPGIYVIRSQADDGGLLGWDEVMVTVTR